MRYYSDDEIRAILGRAEAIGLPLAEGSWLEQLTIAQLDSLVSAIDRRIKKFLNHKERR